MQAAALSVSVSKASVGAAHGTPSLDPTKPDDMATGADAFAQALAGLMGVTAGPSPTTPATTSETATTQTVASKPAPLFAVSLPAPGQAFAAASLAAPAADNASADLSQTLQAAPASEVVAPPQAAPTPPLTAAAADAIAALTPTAAAPVAAPTPPAASAQSAASPALTVQADLPLAFSALSFSVTLSSAATPAAPPAVADQAQTPPVLAATTPAAAPIQPATAKAAPAQPAPVLLTQTATAPDATPPPQPPPASDNTLVAMPIAALTLTADETAAALPTSAASPIKPLATVSTKVLAKADAATAPASAQPGSTAPADQPAGAAPATAPVVTEAANRDAKAASDTPGQAPETQSASNGGDNASLNGLAAAPVGPQAALQTPANLAAANGAAIVSQIATQVAKSVDGKSTRFDISLDPAGLGHVNVKVEIGAQGQITAQLSFDNAHTAAEAKSQAGQLQQALEQAGFNIAQGALSFDVGGQGGGFAGQDASAQQPLATSVQTSDLSTTPQSAAVAVASSRPASGVDITI